MPGGFENATVSTVALPDAERGPPKRPPPLSVTEQVTVHVPGPGVVHAICSDAVVGGEA